MIIQFKIKVIILIFLLFWIFIELIRIIINLGVIPELEDEELAIPGLKVVKKTKDIYETGFTWSESDLCPSRGDKLDVFIFVLSAPNNYRNRLAIRQTWGTYRTSPGVALGFLIGTSKNSTRHKIIMEEQKMYNDLIIAKFIDNYNNLTLKTISMLEWADKKCSKAKFILKIDDDVYLNVENLKKFMSNHSKDKKRIYGRVLDESMPYRDNSSKYFVGVYEYEPSVYPQYVVGPAYMLTSDIIHDLFSMALEAPYFRFEDVHITGFLASQLLNIDLIDVFGFHYTSSKNLLNSPCFIKRDMITFHKYLPSEMFGLWKKEFQYRKLKCL